MKSTLLLCLISLFICSCSPAENSFLPTERIAVASGPEDMVIDQSTGDIRLLISCASRREGEKSFEGRVERGV